MTERHKQILNSIGFDWDAKAPGTSTRLVAYKKEHNDTIVPRGYNKDPQLGRWVDTQRRYYKKNKMTERHKHLLDSVGFVWDARALGTTTAKWEEMYQ